MPDLKLIFLMREPIARSWSHAKHNFLVHEANFVSNTSTFEAVSESLWRENFVHEWPLASGDYLGQLRRWLSVFPREQIYVDFYESVAHDPQALLRNVFAFLGVAQDVDLSAFPHAEKILRGLPRELPPSLRRFLQQLHGDRTRELESFLHEQFGLSLPSEWEANFASSGDIPVEEGHTAAAEGPPMVVRLDFEGQRLATVLERGESAAPVPALVLDNYRGSRIVCHRGQFLVVSREFGFEGLRGTGPAELEQQRDRGIDFVASSLLQAKDWVDRHILARIQAQLRTLQAQVEAIGPLQCSLQDAGEHILRLEELLGRFTASPCRFILSTQIRRSFPRLAAFLSSLFRPSR
jgi:hypothetical protein